MEGMPVFVQVCWYQLLGAQMMSRTLFWPVSTRIVSNNLTIGAEQLRDRYFFASDKADGYFVNSPLEWVFGVFVEEDILDSLDVDIFTVMIWDSFVVT